jgi:hypothetical protein
MAHLVGGACCSYTFSRFDYQNAVLNANVLLMLLLSLRLFSGGGMAAVA